MHQPTEHQADLILVRQVRKGDSAAVQEFIARMACVREILTARNIRLGRPLGDHEIPDVVQDTVMAILRKLDTFAGHAALETWAYRFCNHELMNAVRRKQRERRLRSDAGIEITEPTAMPEPEPFDFQLVYEGLDKLGAPEAMVIRMKHLSGLKFEAIAARLNISTNTAKTRYYRGLEKLRQILRPRLMEDEA